MTVSTLDSVSSPCGTRIWKPVSDVTGADVLRTDEQAVPRVPGATHRSSPNTSQATPSSNGVNPS